MRPLPVRIALFALLAALGLTGCGDDGAVDAEAAPTASASAQPVAPSASPTPTGPDRSPEALAALLKFTAPPFDDPLVQEAVDGYQEHLRQLMVAQGLSDAERPALIATVDPAFREAALGSTARNQRGGYYLTGPYVEKVVDAAGSEGQVFLTSCADLRQRKVYEVATDAPAELPPSQVRPVTVTMTRAAQGWVLSNYVSNADLTCS